MHEDLLAEAWQQAERSQPLVRAAALMRIARVQTASNPPQALQTFQQALAEVRHLTGSDRETLLDEATLLTAAIAPNLLHGPCSNGCVHADWRNKDYNTYSQ